MARKVRFVPNSRGINTFLNSRTAERAVSDPADRVVAAAQAAAPVRTGRYRNSIHKEFARTDRVVARVGSDLDYALALEAILGTLGRALGNR